MNREYIIRGYEGGITILSTYLSISSFFRSSLYSTIANGIDQILRLFGVRTISSSQVTLYIPLIVTAIVVLIIFYDYFMGRPEDIIDIYQINLLLITPEVLSYSKLDWLNLIKRPQILEPTRNALPVFLSGSILFLGYLSLFFLSRSRESLDDLRYRGVDEEQINVIFEKQTGRIVFLTFISCLIALGVFILGGPLSTTLLSFVGDFSFNYLIFGVPGIILLLASLWLFIKIEEKKI